MRKHSLIALVAFAVLATLTLVGAAGAGTFNAVPTSAVAPVPRAELSAALLFRDRANARILRAVANREAVAADEHDTANWYLHGADRTAMHSPGRVPGTGLPSEWFKFVRRVAQQQATQRAQYAAAVGADQVATDVVEAPASLTGSPGEVTAADSWQAEATTATVSQPAEPPAAGSLSSAVVPPGGSSSGGIGGPWLELRQCESGDNYSLDTGNGYYGAYQFSLGTWEALGFSGFPSDASPAVQDQAAEELLSASGWGAWPGCSAELGY